MTLQLKPSSPWRVVSAAATWHLSSQQGARRNALVAGTALTQRRLERLEVEEFVAEHAQRREAAAGTVQARRASGPRRAG